MNPVEETLEMARKFISGEDRSMGFVASMENIVVEHLSDSEVFEFLAEGISLYRPWAGAPYWSEEDMIQLMEDFVKEFGPSEDS
ncbi:hypothetical protein ACKI1I_33165 [Streptomyces turgidiscabies]|uniref:hypothetical protein n=1 Tax=Streptomyces TaxID=1883 RepID=UPI00117C071E|nr:MULTISPECIES: hypothetical protein [Streptomyces]MDX3497047.1 hypothetical protein [Streptomyces turgidiscabies]